MSLFHHHLLDLPVDLGIHLIHPVQHYQQILLVLDYQVIQEYLQILLVQLNQFLLPDQTVP